VMGCSFQKVGGTALEESVKESQHQYVTFFALYCPELTLFNRSTGGSANIILLVFFKSLHRPALNKYSMVTANQVTGTMSPIIFKTRILLSAIDFAH
jgi:hypothetical protein